MQLILEPLPQWQHQIIMIFTPVVITWHITSLASLQSSSGKDANSLDVMPPFTSASDLHLTNTTLSGLGTPITAVPVDIDGTPRNTIAPTIGAHELPLLPFDAGVAQILQPTGTLNEGDTSNVEVIIANFGTDTITSLSISYFVNNGTPVTQSWTGSMTQWTTDTVLLQDMIMPPGLGTICAYTALAGDSNTFNDTMCGGFFGTPLYDAYVTRIEDIEEGCNLGMDTVSIWIWNIGVDTIDSGLTAYYQVDGLSPLVTQSVPDTIIPGDSIMFAFSTLFDFSVGLTDSVFDVKAWISLVGDGVQYNDTAETDVESIHLPLAPIVSDTTIPYGSWVTLTAISNDSVAWYQYDTSTLELTTGLIYTTPILFDTTVYWLEACGGAQGQGGNIAPMATPTASACNTGPCSTLNDLNYGVCGSQQMWVPTSGPPSLTPGVDWIAFEWPAAKSIESMTIHHAESTGRFLTGFTLQTWNGGSWVTQFTISSLPMQCINHIPFPIVINTKQFRITSFQMTGTGQNSNPNFREMEIWEALLPGCCSNRVPLAVMVSGIPPGDLALTSISTPEGCGLDSLTPVTIGIYNQGTDTVTSNTTASYKIDANPYITPETVTNTIVIPPGDTTYYTFATPADFTAYVDDTMFNIIAWIYNSVGDPNQQNDTISKDSIESLYTASPPTVISPITITYGTSTTLSAIPANVGDSLYWFDVPVGGSDLGVGTQYTTVPLFDTTTYYVEGVTGGSGGLYILGTGTTTNTNTTYPAPYGNWYWGSKEQYLILASEMQALGAAGGPISSIAFDVVTIQGTALQNFEIKMGHTSVSSFSTAFTSGLTSVYSISSYTETTGWNIHNFSTPFIWNGADNIVVEVCFNNSSYTYNAVVNQTTTPFVSCINYHSDATGVCSQTSGTTYSQRPNMQIVASGGACPSPRVPLIVQTTSPPPVDAGAYAITNPVGSTPSGIPTPINIVIKNYGTNTLTSAIVNYSVNGVPGTPYSWTGSILPDSMSIPLTVSVDTFLGGIYCIKAWTSMPNSVADTVNLNDTTVSCFNACLSGTYTVGTSSSDFPTIELAKQALDSSGVCGTVVFNIASGTYNLAGGQIEFDEIPGASDVNTITFQSATGDSTDVIITGAGTSSAASYVLLLDGADYMRFKHLTIKTTSSSYPGVIEVANGAMYNEFSNNVIEGYPSASTSYARNIYDYTTLNHYNAYKYNRITGGYYGMYIYGGGTTSWQKGTLIEGNDISGFYYYGIMSYYQDSIQMIGNYIHDGVYSYNYGIYTYYNFNNFRIEGNNISLSAPSYSYALRVYYCNYYAYMGTSGPGIVANNFISITAGTGTNYGLYAYYSNNVKYYHNTVNISAGGTSSRALYQYNTTGNSIGQTFVNNIFASTSGGYAAYYGTPTTIPNADYNDYYTTGSYLTYWNGNRSDLSAHQLASSKDSNSISVDPGFVSATNLHVTTFDLNAAATPVPEVTHDIDGDLRDLVIPDIGADEFDPPLNDAGVLSIDAPTSPAVIGVQDIKVTLKNFGLDTLTSVTIYYNINNSATNIDSLWTGSLATAEIDTGIVLGQYNFPSGQTAIKA
ncbi:hypothetical protein ACFLRZ_05150, partial [Bacteroidota bacterium]